MVFRSLLPLNNPPWRRVVQGSTIGLLPTWLLILSLGLVFLPACSERTSVEYGDEAAAALERGDWVTALKEAQAAEQWEKTDADLRFDGGRRHWEESEYLRVRRTKWILAQAQAHATRDQQIEARDTLIFRFCKADPDAFWVLLPILRQLGSLEEHQDWLNSKRNKAGQWDRYTQRYPALLVILPFAYDRGHPTSAAAALLPLANYAEHASERGAIHALRGDLLARAGRHGEALAAYQTAQTQILGEPECPKSPLDLRLARTHTALGHWDLARNSLSQISTGQLLAPGQRAELAAVEQQVQQGLTAAAVARGDMPTPPPGLTLASALDRLQGVTRTAGTNGTITWTGPGGLSVTLEPDGSGRAMIEHLSEAVPIRADHRDTPAIWDPRRHCFRYDTFAGNRALILFANGDLFVGHPGFSAHGVYASATRAPLVGPCCFGMPRERAWTIVRTHQQSPLGSRSPSGSSTEEVLIRADLVDGATVEAVGVVVDGRLVPTRQATFVYPGTGAFIGWFRAGSPHLGGYFTPRGDLEVYQPDQPPKTWWSRATYSVDLGTCPKRMTHVGHWLEMPWLNPFTWRPAREFTVWDAASGLELRVDDQLTCTAALNQERIAELRMHQEADRKLNEHLAQREKENEERARERQREAQAEAEYRRAHPEVVAAEQAERAARQTAFQIYQEPPQDTCLKCGGAGAQYQNGSITQGSKWDPVAGHWRDTATHTSGSMVTCTWCQGTGRR